MKPNFSQIQVITQTEPQTVRWPGFLLVFMAWLCQLVIWRFFEIAPVPTTQNTIPRREPTRRFAFWKLGLTYVLLVSQQVNGQSLRSEAHVSPSTTHSDYVQSPPTTARCARRPLLSSRILRSLSNPARAIPGACVRARWSQWLQSARSHPLWEARVNKITQPDSGIWKFTYNGLRGQVPSAELVIQTEVLNPCDVLTRYELNRMA